MNNDLIKQAFIDAGLTATDYKQAEDTVAAWEYVIKSAEVSSGDPSFRVKLAAELSAYLQLSKQADWQQDLTEFTRNGGEKIQNALKQYIPAIDNMSPGTLGGGAMGMGGGTLLGLIISLITRSPIMKSMLVGALGGGAFGGAYSGGHLDGIFHNASPEMRNDKAVASASKGMLSTDSNPAGNDNPGSLHTHPGGNQPAQPVAQTKPGQPITPPTVAPITPPPTQQPQHQAPPVAPPAGKPMPLNIQAPTNTLPGFSTPGTPGMKWDANGPYKPAGR